MNRASVPRATLGRLPIYLEYLRSLPEGCCANISATTIARALGFGEVQVRKDLSSISGEGKPKIGYVTAELIGKLESFLGVGSLSRAVIIGAGKLGKALLDYNGFAAYGLDIAAAFDCDSSVVGRNASGKFIYSLDSFEEFCKKVPVRIGIITVPARFAQETCDRMLASGIKAIWNFAPCVLSVPDDVILQQENLALSLAYLNLQTPE